VASVIGLVGRPDACKGLRVPEATLAGKTPFMSGGSSGIGLAIALRAGRRRQRAFVATKTGAPDPRLPGTVLINNARVLDLSPSPSSPSSAST
jgi:NAD(P)-dependent dehydrogenase (short-subunit alcohol dehydrogenase family)